LSINGCLLISAYNDVALSRESLVELLRLLVRTVDRYYDAGSRRLVMDTLDVLGRFEDFCKAAVVILHAPVMSASQKESSA
jgi:hypothetical protein